ncbi:MAG: hypothetical protein IPM79_28760 [Polyangiaceae bacterium]|nr:hypothetical protein [Polyangiaceae bacterium]
MQTFACSGPEVAGSYSGAISGAPQTGALRSLAPASARLARHWARVSGCSTTSGLPWPVHLPLARTASSAASCESSSSCITRIRRSISARCSASVLPMTSGSGSSHGSRSGDGAVDADADAAAVAAGSAVAAALGAGASPPG